MGNGIFIALALLALVGLLFGCASYTHQEPSVEQELERVIMRCKYELHPAEPQAIYLACEKMRIN